MNAVIIEFYKKLQKQIDLVKEHNEKTIIMVTGHSFRKPELDDNIQTKKNAWKKYNKIKDLQEKTTS